MPKSMASKRKTPARGKVRARPIRKPQPMFNNVAIIGMGLIGGSIALDGRRLGVFGKIHAAGRTMENLKKAKRMKLADQITQDPVEAVKGKDLVIIGTPVKSIASIMKKIAPALEEGVIVTDVGSVKEPIMDDAERYLPEGVKFVGGHPIAGSEKRGAASSIKGLFKGKAVIVTPDENTDKAALRKVKAMWRKLGSKVFQMDAQHHDFVLAAVSHLPHVTAYSMVLAVLGLEGTSEFIKYAGASFKDVTRVAASPSEIWRDICELNSDNIIKMIDLYEDKLGTIKKLIINGKFDELAARFDTAQSARLRH